MADTAIASASLRRADKSALDHREKRFFLFLAVLCAIFVFLGFSPSFYLKDVIHAPPALSAMTRVHGVVFTAWVLLFVTQAALINAGNPALHRRLGLMGAALMGAVIAIGVPTAINAGRLGHSPPGTPPTLYFMAVPLAGIAATATLFLSALWNRARRDAHMRYMLAGFISMMPPATHRIFLGMGLPNQALWLAFAIMDALLLVAVLHDLKARRSIHSAYLWSALSFVIAQAAIVWAFSSSLWLSAAHWLIQT